MEEIGKKRSGSADRHAPPDRQFVACVDTGYAGKSVLRHLPVNVDLISQVHPQGVLYAPPPPPTGKRGARRKKGERLPDLAG